MPRRNSETVRTDHHEILRGRSSNSKRSSPESGNTADVALDAPTAAEVPDLVDGRQTWSTRRWVNRKFQRLRTRLRLAKRTPRYIPAAFARCHASGVGPEELRGRDTDRNEAGATSVQPGLLGGKILDVAHDQSRGQDTIPSGGGQPTTSDAVDRGLHGDPLFVPIGKSQQRSQRLLHGHIPAYLQTQIPPDTGSSASANKVQPLDAASSPAARVMTSTASYANPHMEGREHKRQFRMAIHLKDQQHAQRICRLDTFADLDVISQDVVEDLQLPKEKWEKGMIRPLGLFFRPEWQVTFNWNVAKFPKTYTSTFAVIPKEISTELDVLIGDSTIERIGFYNTNDAVW
ncbi:MAG: hypothetical protein Q9193_004404 [Seirophora villosa]